MFGGRGINRSAAGAGSAGSTGDVGGVKNSSSSPRGLDFLIFSGGLGARSFQQLGLACSAA